MGAAIQKGWGWVGRFPRAARRVRRGVLLPHRPLRGLPEPLPDYQESCRSSAAGTASGASAAAAVSVRSAESLLPGLGSWAREVPRGPGAGSGEVAWVRPPRGREACLCLCLGLCLCLRLTPRPRTSAGAGFASRPPPGANLTDVPLPPSAPATPGACARISRDRQRVTVTSREVSSPPLNPRVFSAPLPLSFYYF